MTDETLPKLVPVETGLPEDQAGLVENLRTRPNSELAEMVYEALTASREALEKVAAMTQMVAELNAAVIALSKRVSEDHQSLHRIQASQAECGPVGGEESRVVPPATEAPRVVDVVWESGLSGDV